MKTAGKVVIMRSKSILAQSPYSQKIVSNVGLT